MTDRLAQAMRDAISSLTYIANTACKRDEELMADAINVRGYARSRASAAEAALAAHEAEHSQCAAPAHEPGTKVLAAAAPAGWSIEYLWDGKISIAGGGYKAFLIEPSGGVAEKILWELAKALATQPPAVGPDIPESIQKIIENLHTQDNRITANPLFAVQQKRVIGGLESGYEDGWAWVDSDGEIHDAERIGELNARFKDGESEPDGCRRVGYAEKWEFVTGCLTEEGCKQYLRLDGHNLNEPRIYAYGGYRNVELEALRKWLMSLRGMTHLGESKPPVQHKGGE